MNTIKIKTERTAEESIVCCCDHVLEEVLPAALKDYRGALIFTDANIFHLYGEMLTKYFPTVPVYAMPAGEVNKTAKTLFAVLEAMAKAGLHRGSALIALGGGVVGDIGGLAAGLYMRGIDCIQVPTTLLAQVDSSVGGKTAVDFHGVKNLIGLFKQPKLVLADPAFFTTLPARELRCGLGEIVKHAALNGGLFDLLLENRERFFDFAFLGEIVPKNIEFKASIVMQDPHENGLRKCLNLGHTTGHAVELYAKTLSHGECVLIGIIYEAEIARRYRTCDDAYLRELEQLCLEILDRDLTSIDIAKAAELAKLDKKNETSDMITICAPAKKGEHVLFSLGYEEYRAALVEIKETLC